MAVTASPTPRRSPALPEVAVPEPRVSVIVPARNAESTIEGLLTGLRAQTVASFEVIVVDSGSADRTVSIVERAALGPGRSLRLLQNPGGEPAGSRNIGARAASGAVLAFTDSDCAPDPDWLERGLAALGSARSGAGGSDDATGSLDLVQGRVLPAGPVGPFERTVSVGHESGLYETANLFVRRSVFNGVGGFQPLPGFAIGDGRPFGEDSWFAWRCKRAGAASGFCLESVVRHAVLPGDLQGFVAEHWRRRYFPVLVAAIPELRDTFMWNRWFLGPGTAQFDAALVGLALASRHRRELGLAAPYAISLALAAPYAVSLARTARRQPGGGRIRCVRAGAQLAADVVGCAALVAGSVRSRTVVL